MLYTFTQSAPYSLERAHGAPCLPRTVEAQPVARNPKILVADWQLVCSPAAPGVQHGSCDLHSWPKHLATIDRSLHLDRGPRQILMRALVNHGCPAPV